MPKVTVYGADWCGDCVRSKYFLDRHKIEYEYIDIENNTVLADRVVDYNIEAGYGARCRIPIILIDDLILSEPSNGELGRALGIAGSQD